MKTAYICAQRDNFIISTDKARLDIEMIYQFLGSSYWANQRAIEQVKESIQHSLCFGVYEQNTQIGFARILTDYATFSYLADVFILPAYRGAGLGKWLISLPRTGDDKVGKIVLTVTYDLIMCQFKMDVTCITSQRKRKNL